MSDEKAVSNSTILAAVFLVAGTCIGGGMLALPITLGVSGFFPAAATMAVCWLAMSLTALLLVEANLWMEEGAHIITMASRLLGPYGKWVSWLIYLFICYASLVAYTAGGGVQLADFISSFTGWEISMEVGCIAFIALFGGVIELGSRALGRVNALLFIGMIIGFLALVSGGIREVKLSYLANSNWGSSLMAIPLLLTAFSFQTIVPSLTPYLKRNVKALRAAVLLGAFMAFTVYLIWLFLIMGIVPVSGPNGLAAVLSSGDPTSQFLRQHVQGQWVAISMEFFAFFAIVTSFLGITFGLYDFLADGLHIKKSGWGKLILGALIALPTLICATRFEKVFLYALDITGGFGDSILNGIIPVLMVWIGRYRLGYSRESAFGGKPLLLLILSFFSATLLLEILAHLGHISSIYDGYYDIHQLHNPESILE